MTPERRVLIPVQNLVSQGGTSDRSLDFPTGSGMHTNLALGSHFISL